MLYSSRERLTHSQKTLNWIIKLSERLDKDYIYNFTIRSQTQRGATSQTNFLATARDRDYSEEYVSKYINDEQEEKQFTSLLEAICYPSKDKYYSFEEISIQCILKNKGNTKQEGIELSLDDQKHSFDLDIGKTKELVFTIENTVIGDIDQLINVKSSDLNKKIRVSYKVIGDAQVIISGIEVPSQITPDEQFQIIFTVSKNTSTEPKNIVAKLINKDVKKEWQIENLSVDRRFIVNVGKYYLSDEYNEFQLIAEYTNKLGEQKTFQKSFTIKQTDLTFINRAKIKMNKLSMGAVYWIATIIVGSLFAMFLISLIFRRTKPGDNIPIHQGQQLR